VRRSTDVRDSSVAPRRLTPLLALLAAAAIGAAMPLDAPWTQMLAPVGLLVLALGSMRRAPAQEPGTEATGASRHSAPTASEPDSIAAPLLDSFGDQVARERLALRAGRVGTWHWQVTSGRLLWSADAESLLGLAAGTLGSTLEDHLRVVHPGDRDGLLVRLADAVAAQANLDVLYRVVDADGTVARLCLLGNTVHDGDGRVEVVSGVVYAGSRHDAVSAAPDADEDHGLAGVESRATLVHTLTRDLLARNEERLVGLLVVDVRNVNEINEALGHEVGDQFLACVSDRLRSLARGDDLVARVGGHQFALLPRPVPAIDGFSGLAEAVLAAMETPVTLDGVELHAVLNLGVAVQTPNVTATELLRRADIASRQSRSTPGTFQFYSAAHETDRRRRLALVGALKEALRNGDLELHYQPKMHLTTGRVVGAEALLRWPRADGDVVGPAEFLPLAEQAGLMNQVTGFVLRSALAQCRDWLDAGLRLPVAVNVSPECIAADGFADRVVSELKAAGIEPALLTLEITETSLASAVHAELADRLLTLRQLGVRLSVDDFGTGYSSLAYLKHLPVHEIKIDRAFLADALFDYRDQAVVAATLSLGRAFDTTVVAEGIGTPKAADLARRLGCIVGQGYGLARPLPVARLSALLTETGIEPEECRYR
jgi:diguanylate cyclase (GGDEF)-like protein